MRLRALFGLAVTCWLVPTATAAGDPPPSLDLRGFSAPLDHASGLYLEPAETPHTWDYNMGLWFNYAHRPVTLRDQNDEVAFSVIDHQVSADLIANVGFEKRLSLGFDLPFVVAQDGDETASSPDAQRVLGSSELPLTALGDLGIGGKLTLIQPTGGEFGGFALAFTERFTFPTGDEASYIGEGHVTSTSRLLAEYRLVAVGMHLSAGAKFRGEEERFACAQVAPDDEDGCATQFGHELPFGLGLSFKPQALGIDDAGRWMWFLETHGHLPLSPVGPFDESRVSALSAGLGARVNIRDVSILAGVETALLDGVGTAPIRGILNVGWAPRVHDSDDDGIEDVVDQCRELPEDRDGFEDDDGCPEGDNDDDAVPDSEDKCNLEPEDEDGFEDDDGCPDDDNDGDGILDDDDACPDEAGIQRPDEKQNGCPIRDTDADGIEGEADKCPDEKEDKDGFEDEDGCPDLDNDGDGVSDKADACPNVKGVKSTDSKQNGCPDPDPDRDTFPNAAQKGAVGVVVDKCPDQAEVFDGVKDDDGCPDGDDAPKGRPLVEIRTPATGAQVRMSRGVAFNDKHEIEPASDPLVRALAVELMKREGWTVDVGVRPSPTKGKEEGAKKRAEAVVAALKRFTRKPGVAKVVDFSAVRGQPGAAAHGIGWKLHEPAKPAAKPAKPDAPAKSPAPAPPAPAPPAPKKP